MGATETIAKWIVNTNYEDIPPDAIRVANESCFDLLGVILAGSVEPVGTHHRAICCRPRGYA